MDNEMKKSPSKGQGGAPATHGSGAGRPADVKEQVVSAAQSRLGQVSDGLAEAGDRVRQARDDAGEIYRKAQDATRDGYERASNWASDRYDSVSQRADDARRRSVSELDRLKRGAEDLVKHNPVMIGVAGLAAGLLIGALLPRTQRENEAFGRISDDVREQGRRYALDLAREGRERLSEAFEKQLAPDA